MGWTAATGSLDPGESSVGRIAKQNLVYEMAFYPSVYVKNVVFYRPIVDNSFILQVR